MSEMPPQNETTIQELLRLESRALVTVNGETLSGKAALVKAIWSLVATGEVWLAGRLLSVKSVREWAQAVRWLMPYLEHQTDEPDEIVVHVVREDLARKEDANAGEPETYTWRLPYDPKIDR